jgi:hypothetical protein
MGSVTLETCDGAGTKKEDILWRMVMRAWSG